LIYNLGDDNYGLWVLILSTLGWFKFVDMGFSSAVQRNIGIAIASNDNQRVNATFSVAVVLFSVLGLTAALCILLIAFFPSLLGVDELNYTTTTVALSVLAIKVFWDFLMYAFHGLYTAHLRMDIDANISSLNTIVRVVLIYVLVKELNIYGAVLATIGADIVTQCLKIYYAKKIHKSLQFDKKLVSWNEVRELFAFSKHVIAMSLAKSLNGRVDPIIITHLLGLKMVALYSVVSRLVAQVEGLVNALVGVFHPMIIKLTAQKVNTEETIKKIFSVNYVVVVILFSPLAIFSESFIRLWIGGEYSAVAYLSVSLGFAYICRAVSRPITSVLLAEAKHKLLSIVSLVGAIFNIILSIWFGTYYGLFGIAIGTAIGFFISNVILHLILYKRYCNRPVFPMLKEFLLVCILYGLFILVGKYCIESIPDLGWGGLIMSGLIVELFIVLFTIYLLLHDDFKEQLIKYISCKFKST